MSMPLDSTLESILDLARWAPSGDNTQPWRFEIVDARRIVVHGFDTREHCVYDLDGHPSQISLGALIESLAIAASGHGLQMRALRRADTADNAPTFDVAFEAAPGLGADALAACLPRRSVQRRPLRTRALSAAEKDALAAALPPGYRVVWLEGFGKRLAAARLMFANAKLRLTMPEAHQVHRAVIEWNARFSEDRIPDQALGVDPLTAKLMRWIMQSWRRVEFFNTYLAGTVAPRIQMDLIPGLACAAHFVLVAERPAQSTDDYVAAGRAMQRFWLTATRLALQLQPELTPLIFARYVREGRAFSATAGMHERARLLAGRCAALLGDEDSRRAVFMGRIGAGAAAAARSTRRPLHELIVTRGA
ncbi:nitroreductase family protein [Janthinobacterium fluminis]|uniref:Nitroreductase family protein n=1 Tax=Janthinobacterium fluminis TaxID=2987524 RepID=A0ABT5JVJ4_9BURK|nr:nitroreductase family protein [Janthinobacterium fluminis]MDC8756178.1 nitroreductase family protein [Janthinobacterium fluminis]